MSKKFMKKILLSLLTVCILLSCIPVDTVLAAGNRALAVPYSFKNLTWEKNGDKCGFENLYSIILPGKEKKSSLKNLKMGAVVYIPKKAIKRKESRINLGLYLDIMKKDEYIGEISPRVTVVLTNENGKTKLYAWDELKQKDVKASKYASFKTGKGKYKDYYIVTLKNLPLMQEIVMDGDGSGKRVKITENTKYVFNTGLSITGEGYKTSGTLYLNELTVTSSGKKIVNHTFAKKPSFYEVFNRDKALSKKKVKIVNF